MIKYDLENLIQEVYDNKISSGLSCSDTSKCLDNEILFGLYNGSLAESNHKSAIEHLGKCELCCVDLAFYSELMSMNQDKQATSDKQYDCEASVPKTLKSTKTYEINEEIDLPLEQLLVISPHSMLSRRMKSTVRDNKVITLKTVPVLDSSGTMWEMKTLTQGMVEEIEKSLERCPIGKVCIFEKLTMSVMQASLRGLIDCGSVRRSFRSQDPQGDIELPINPEALSEIPLWKEWCQQYAIKSIIVEVKNKKSRTNHNDVKQLKLSLDTANKGHFGILVSRSGFSKNSIKVLHTYASSNQALILPLNYKDLKELLRLSGHSLLEVLRFLRRKKTLLLQHA